jgi:hypothetical protein
VEGPQRALQFFNFPLFQQTLLVNLHPSFLFEVLKLENLRARLRKMSDGELVRFGKAARSLCRDSRCPDTFKRQLEEARQSGAGDTRSPPVD